MAPSLKRDENLLSSISVLTLAHSVSAIAWVNILADLSLLYVVPIFSPFSSSCLQKRLSAHLPRKAVILCLFFGDSWACRVVESSSIPKVDRQVEGPCSLTWSTAGCMPAYCCSKLGRLAVLTSKNHLSNAAGNQPHGCELPSAGLCLQ